VRRVLEKNPGIKIVGEAENGKEALPLTEELLPDVLLLDVEMPDLKGYKVARKLTARKTPVRILALSSYTEKSYILGMLTSGAAG
jgi:DNA-binding NarL/FixJ family response regulator